MSVSERESSNSAGVNTLTSTFPGEPGGTITARVSSPFAATPLLSMATTVSSKVTSKAPTRLSPVIITVSPPSVDPAVSSSEAIDGVP